MQDEAIAIQRGDVVRLPDVLGLGADYLVRIMSNELISYGQYQLTAEQYSEAMYDVNVSPADDGVAIPVGGIIAYFGDGVPSGFSAFDSAGDRLLKGCALGDEGEYNQPDFSASGTTNYEALHTHIDIENGGYGDASPNGYYSANEFSGAHSHTVSASLSLKDSPKRAGLKLIIAGIESAAPIASAVFSTTAISSPFFAEFSESIGLYASSGSGTLINGSGDVTRCSLTVNSSTISEAPNHAHGRQMYSESPLNPTSGALPAGAHSHLLTGSNTAALRMSYIRCALYVAQVAAAIPERSIIGFSGSVIPVGWKLCTDLTDRFIKISKSTDAGSKLTDNPSPAAILETDTVGHAHTISQSSVLDRTGGGDYFGTYLEFHRHIATLPISDTVQPPHYKLVFIEPSGE